MNILLRHSIAACCSSATVFITVGLRRPDHLIPPDCKREFLYDRVI
jgi:hypothetical protein